MVYFFSTVILLSDTFLLFVVKWGKETFNVPLNSIINTLTTPMQGTSSTTVLPMVKYCLIPLVVTVVLCSAWIILDCFKLSHKVSKIFHRCVFILGAIYFLLDIGYTQYSYDFVGYFKLQHTVTGFYEANYVDPKTVSIESESQRNLIYIYLESMETSYASKEDGGGQENNYIPNLTELAADNISFSNTDLLGGWYNSSGSGWTMGALFATTSGVPFAFPVGGNDMEGAEIFASGIYNLGDFLHDQGYIQEFLCGSDATFAGRRTYFTQHGDYEIFDLYTAREEGYIAEDYYQWWGFEDYILYDIARDELTRLAETGEPFNFTMLTADTHHIDGFHCILCEDTYEWNLENVLICADSQIASFIQWIQEQEFYENTTIVITGDHDRMDTSLVFWLSAEERPIYNCYINVDDLCLENVNDEILKNRSFMAIDTFPTVLAAMGYTIEGNQLGLGVNLFSGKPTLSEQYGCAELDELLQTDNTYYVSLFAPEMYSYVPICTIDLTADGYDADIITMDGVSDTEEDYIWTVGREASFVINLGRQFDEVYVEIANDDVNGATQTYRVELDSETLTEGEISSGDVISFNAKVQNGYCAFTLCFPDIQNNEMNGIALTQITI